MEIIFLSLDVLNTLRFPRDSSPAPTLFPPLSFQLSSFSFPLFSNPTLSLSNHQSLVVPRVMSVVSIARRTCAFSCRHEPDQTVSDWLPSEQGSSFLFYPPSLPSIPLSLFLFFLSCTSFFSSLLLPLTFLSSFLPTLFSSPISLLFANFLPLLHHSFPHFDPPPKPVPTTRERERESRKSLAHCNPRRRWPKVASWFPTMDNNVLQKGICDCFMDHFMKGPHREYLFLFSWKKRKKETHHSLVNLQSTATGLETMLLSLFSLQTNVFLIVSESRLMTLPFENFSTIKLSSRVLPLFTTANLFDFYVCECVLEQRISFHLRERFLLDFYVCECVLEQRISFHLRERFVFFFNSKKFFLPPHFPFTCFTIQKRRGFHGRVFPISLQKIEK